jgi:oligopeptide transport system permease protein
MPPVTDIPAPFVDPLDQAEEGTSLWKDAWHRLKKNRMAFFSTLMLCAMVVFCVVGPFLSPYTYSQINEDASGSIRYAEPPSAKNWFGTDKLGRDQLTRIMYGGRVSLAVGLCASLVSLTIGVLYGAISGFVGGKVDNAMMRFVEILAALPFTVFVILLMVYFGRELWLIFAAIGAVEWLTMARIVRGQVLSLRKMEFIEAAFALGLSRRRIILRHMLPNVLGPVMVYTTLTIPAVMLLEAFLSFLGLGVQAPMSSWGSMIKDGAEVMEEFWWMLIIPGAFLSVTLFCLNFLGDGLRDALDPKASKD